MIGKRSGGAQALGLVLSILSSTRLATSNPPTPHPDFCYSCDCWTQWTQKGECRICGAKKEEGQ